MQLSRSEELLGRLVRPDEQCPYVCILDTGANNAHPLLKPFLDDSDRYTEPSDWDTSDTNGHGTGMAGLAIWGDLAEPLSSTHSISINHKLESVKLLQYPGDNEGKHLGAITANGVYLPKNAKADRRRVFAMALSTTDGRDCGKQVDLAARGQIAVYPAMGWWRTRTKLERFDKRARYALVISISVPKTDIDIYTEVTAQIPVHAKISVS